MAERDFQGWTHDIPGAVRAPVYPDGCRDVVVLWPAGRRPEVRLTPLDLQPRLVDLAAGTRLRGLPSPDYWRLLARARRAAARLAGAEPLAAIAADCGFSDQAQMTRDLRRWFGQTPGQLRADPAMLVLLGQPALGNWSDGGATAEQISTR